VAILETNTRINIMEARPTSDANDRNEYFQMNVKSSDSLIDNDATASEQLQVSGSNSVCNFPVVLTETSLITFFLR